jgi:PST family polysaccharide transporter
MALANRAFGGAFWSILVGLLSRGLGMIGTVVMTHYLAPNVMGEVTTATVLAFTVSWATQLGFAKYLILRATDGTEQVFHVLVLSLVLVAVPLLALVITANWLADWFSTPELHNYLPGMALTVFIRRIGSVPEKLLVRNMRFGTVAAVTAVAEIVYVIAALLLVTQFHWGGMGIVLGNIVQATLLVTLLTAACGTRSWFTPVPLRMARFREILTFGLPLGVVTFLYEFSRYGDKLLFTKLFGPARTGEYNLASSLAEVPANQIGEQVSNVLLPTLLKVEGERRRELLITAVALQFAVLLPLALGLAAVSQTLVKVLLPAHWWGMIPFLAVLAATSVFRPLNGLLSQYLLSLERNQLLMKLEITRVAVMFAALLLLGQIGPIPAAFAVGLASMLHTALLVHRMTRLQISAISMFVATWPALAAALLMCIAVLALRLVPAWQHQATPVLLVTEILVGGAVYVAALAVMSPSIVREFSVRLLEVMRRVRRR